MTVATILQVSVSLLGIFLLFFKEEIKEWIKKQSLQ